MKKILITTTLFIISSLNLLIFGEDTVSKNILITNINIKGADNLIKQISKGFNDEKINIVFTNYKDFENYITNYALLTKITNAINYLIYISIISNKESSIMIEGRLINTLIQSNEFYKYIVSTNTDINDISYNLDYIIKGIVLMLSSQEKPNMPSYWVKNGFGKEVANYLANQNITLIEVSNIIKTYNNFKSRLKDIALINIDFNIIKIFNLNKIDPNLMIEAYKKDITNLDDYNTNFKTNNLTFQDYLDAYGIGINKGSDYLKYKKDHPYVSAIIGFGGFSSTVPNDISDLKYTQGLIGIEVLRKICACEFFGFSIDSDLYIRNVILPFPYIFLNIYAGYDWCFFKIASGISYDYINNGICPANVKVGLEFKKFLQVEIILDRFFDSLKYSNPELIKPSIMLTIKFDRLENL